MHAHPKRFKLALEFDGGRYSGWQMQADAKSIQGSLLKAAAELFGSEVDVQGSGRTDTGVHGMRFVAHLEVHTEQTPKEIGAELNALLPKDIAILECKRAGPRFHARHNCIGRSYLYQIAKRKSALCRDYVWQIPEPLHAGFMQEAATTLVGMHDFSSFTDRQAIKKKSPLVLVHKAQVAETDDLILFRIVGSHFLWKMVRRIVGVLAEVGKGALTVAEVAHFLEEPVELKAYTAPSQGLFFERAFYDQEELDTFLASEELRSPFF
ncbi:tRNA pseudouridine(38-40) synthase TruA [Thiovibrio frasassiensis]|uniref:tRNA pseudouridine synthase A n=1 Tax=Thiovibrio frasassiensis TaxID=2984131 RepID=A0A9X4MCJ1_9BACT|nr:tRNA pseudouridine(38-40) synthase TruA [Thiovibrio frasassiensis]MDG4475049.1 tRNA pseudouridine(38-40) synthase TruA [Thiovibrio frasassiensis]